MQKVLRRTSLAKAQAKRRLAREAEENRTKLKREQREYRDTKNLQRKYVSRLHSELREDLKLGPLAAPIRGIDEKDRIQRDLPPGDMLQPKPLFGKKERRFWNITVGDRVVILTGKDKNKVGTVKTLQKDTDTVIVDGLNIYPIITPPYLAAVGGGDVPAIDQEIAIPYSDLRLVHPVPDPKTGILRDAIVKKIRIEDLKKDRNSGKYTWTRYIAFTETEIPWPEKKEPEYEDVACDTKRMDAELITYIPTLLIPPFPGTVIDELRNKFSVFRDRHDREWVEQKMKEDEEEKAKQKLKIITPLMEINRKIRREKMELGKKQKLTPDILEKIGQAMANSNSPFLPKIPASSRILSAIAEQSTAFTPFSDPGASSST